MKDASIRSIVFVALFTALVIVGAIFSFPAPWNPVVPLTLATLFVILAGLLLGPWRGLATVGLYLFLGIIGFPVFAGGQGGFHVIASPVGGFLLGYLPAAFFAGFITRMGHYRLPMLILATVIATLSIYIPGIPWMHYQLTGIVDDWSWMSSWGKYTLPFLFGDAIKAGVAVGIAWYVKDRIT